MPDILEDKLETLINYKNTRASRYIPVRGDDITSRIFELDNYFVSTKYDGHLCFIIKSKEDVLVCNYNGISFERPELTEEIKSNPNIQNSVLVGEIFSFVDGKRTRSFNLKKDLKDKNSKIKIGVFDIIELNGKEYSENDWSEKKKNINNLFSESNLIFPVAEIEVKSRKDIQSEFNSRVVENNEEGLIVRGIEGPVFKVKPTLNFDFVALGYVMGFSDDYTLLKEILFGVSLSEKDYLVIGKVSSGFSVDDRKNLVKKFEKIHTESNIMEVSGSKLPFTMIKPEYVIEIDALDIINSNSSGLIKKSILSFASDYKKNKNTPSVSLISPVFKGIRSDKKVCTADTGISQVTRVIDIPKEESHSIEKKPSEILKKEVYVKIMKGAKMVKKFFAWKTNGDTDNYPEYIFYHIDYSPTRADKLKREIKVSNSKQQILKIFETQIESDIKTGWNKV